MAAAEARSAARRARQKAEAAETAAKTAEEEQEQMREDARTGPVPPRVPASASVPADEEGELAFFVLDAKAYSEQSNSAPLAPCGITPKNIHLELVGEGMEYEWREGAAVTTGTPASTGDLFRALSPHAVAAAALGLIPDIGAKLVGTIGQWFEGQGFADRSRVAVLHYRSGTIPINLGGIARAPAGSRVR